MVICLHIKPSKQKMFDKLTGNGNGNKMNMRIHVLEQILSSIETDGSSARVNSLRQVIRRNKADMADDAGKSLDLMRRIFQNEITKELQQIMDRHIRTTFSPAIENLKKNGHVVDQDVINDLYTSILDAAKTPFMRDRTSTMNRDRLNSEKSVKRGYESDESDVSILSQSSEVKRRRGRPRKDEEISLDLSPLTLHEVLKWCPERHLLSTRYIPAAKVAALLSIPVAVFFSKYPRMFRYSCDEEDRAMLMEEKKLSRSAGRCYLMVMDDVTELLGRSPDLEFGAFTLNEHILLKMRSRTAPVFERLKARLPPSAYTFNQ
nr:AT hook domain containing protein [Haemonchus contortus]